MRLCRFNDDRLRPVDGESIRDVTAEGVGPVAPGELMTAWVAWVQNVGRIERAVRGA